MKRQDREKIITSDSTLEVIKNLFPEFEDYNYNDYSPEWCLEYKETSKFGIFVMGKGGSTVTNTILSENELSVLDVNKQVYINDSVDDNSNFILGTTEETKVIEELAELKNILLGKSKKDLIFVIRNPILKWMSGISQEIDEELKKSLVATSFIAEKYNLIVDDVSDIFSNRIENDNIKSELLTDLLYKFLSMSVLRKGTSQINHAQLYNEIVYLILENNNNIDLSKVHLIDLDSKKGDLVELIKRYYPNIDVSSAERYWTQSEKYKLLFNGLREHLIKNNPGVYEVIKKEIRRDMMYYYMLNKKYEKNIIK